MNSSRFPQASTFTNRLVFAFIILVSTVVIVLLSPTSECRADTNSDCLRMTPISFALSDMFQGNLFNDCKKPVTAWSAELEISYKDGTSFRNKGAGADYLLGMSAPHGSSIGRLYPGESRDTSLMQVLSKADREKGVTAIRVWIAAVVFDDATASGDPALIDTIFARRRNELKDWEFWNDAFSRYKSELAAAGPLSRLTDLADTSQRLQILEAEQQKKMPVRAAPFVQAIATERNVEYVAGQTNMMRQQLQWIDNLRDQGKMSRSGAVKWVEQYLSGQVANFEANSKRSGQ